MDLFPRTFSEGLEGRLTGPGRFRFVLQPMMSIALGIRDGIADAKQGKPPYAIRVLFEHEHRLELLESGIKQVAVPMTVGIVLDAVLQWVIFQAAYLIPAILAGTILVAFPYVIARGLTNRVARRWYDRKSERETATHTVA